MIAAGIQVMAEASNLPQDAPKFCITPSKIFCKHPLAHLEGYVWRTSPFCSRQLPFKLDITGFTPPLPGNTTRMPIMLSGIHMSLQLSPAYRGQVAPRLLTTGKRIAANPYQINGTHPRPLYSPGTQRWLTLPQCSCARSTHTKT